MADQLYGYGQAAAPRQAAATALLDAVQAITALDGQLYRHPLAPAWARVERELAVAAAQARRTPAAPTPSLFSARDWGRVRCPPAMSR